MFLSWNIFAVDTNAWVWWWLINNFNISIICLYNQWCIIEWLISISKMITNWNPIKNIRYEYYQSFWIKTKDEDFYNPKMLSRQLMSFMDNNKYESMKSILWIHCFGFLWLNEEWLAFSNEFESLQLLVKYLYSVV